ncbi:AAA family ATPase [Streptomyces sp. NPDC058335]|uniref:helix-turn-helix transcriptional regulator n=1 Tax=Streptomyces sp. NPDC058335 TaxID=3346451 RepID=UPI00365B628D
MVTLVEREEQLREIHATLVDLREGKGGVALIDGPSATGKTTVLHHSSAQAAKSGAILLTAMCSRAERTLPFGVVRQLFRHPDVPAEAGRRADALLDAAAAASLPRDEHTDALGAPLLHAFEKLSRILFDLAAQRPLVVEIDDLQHADTPSWHCLLHLVRRLATSRVAMLLTDDPAVEASCLPFRTELNRQPRVRHVRLEPLSRDGVAQLVRTRLGAEQEPRLIAEFHAASGGNPLLLEAMIDDRLRPGGVPGRHYGLALLSCLHRGEPLMLRVSRALAVLGQDAEPAGVGRLADTGADDVRQTVRAMEAAGLLDGGRLRHEWARTALLADLPAANRRELHHRAALLLHELARPAHRIAPHLVEADRAGEPWAIAALLAAASQATGEDRTAAAVAFLALAHRECADPGQRTAILARLVQAQWQSDPATAARHLPELLRDVRARSASSRDRAMLIRQLLWNGMTEEATTVLEELRLSTHGRGGEELRSLRDLELWLRATHAPLARLLHPPASPAGLRPGGAVPDQHTWLESTGLLSDRIARGQCRSGVEQADRMLRELRLTPDDIWAEESALLALLTLVCADQSGKAAAHGERLAAEAETRRAPTWQAVFAAARADIALRQGRLADAAELAETALDRLAPRSWGVAVGFPLGVLILARSRMGQYEEVTTLLAQPVPDAMFQSRYSLPYLFARGHHHLATNHHHAALADFLCCGELMRNWGLDVVGLAAWRTGAADAWFRLGNQDQAKQLLHDQLARPGIDGTSTRAVALRLLATTCQPGRRLQLLTEALELTEATLDRFEQARVLADLSRASHALGQSRRARLLIRQALHIADLCGAKPLSRDLLSVAGGGDTLVPLSGGSDGIRDLSESERRVASLAVMGHTNREIAGRLYITPSTVEQHLTRVYRKLNVKRRKDLPADLWTASSSAG